MPLETLALPLSSTARSPNPQHSSGFFATKFTEYELLHQHVDAGKLIYRYPNIQYKIIGGTPMVIKSELADVAGFERAVVRFVGAM